MWVHFVTTRHLTHMYTNTFWRETAVCSESVCFGSESNRPSSPWQTIPGILNKLFIWTSSLPAACLNPPPRSLSPSKATDWASLNESGFVCVHTKNWPNTATPMITHTSSALIQQRVLQDKMRKKMKTEETVLNTGDSSSGASEAQ